MSLRRCGALANWTDRGLVLKSDPRDDFNAIDPFRIDLSDGRAFLAFGSFWSGIKLRELDPATGKLIPEDTPMIPLASRHGGAIEAASILEHDERFYLFVSFDQCCKGVASTYNIRVGRADRIEGPYLDREGRSMLDGGGTLVLGTTGRFIGPGGQEPVKTAKGEMLVYHYYDGADAGVAKLELAPIRWSCGRLARARPASAMSLGRRRLALRRSAGRPAPWPPGRAGV